MKTIIGNKIYDTEKAKLVLEYQQKERVTNTILGEYMESVACELYNTNNDAWFAHVGINMCNSIVHVLSKDEAKEIIKSVDPDMYISMYDDCTEA